MLGWGSGVSEVWSCEFEVEGFGDVGLLGFSQHLRGEVP